MITSQFKMGMLKNDILFNKIINKIFLNARY
jgi:hypothetical protein